MREFYTLPRLYVDTDLVADSAVALHREQAHKLGTVLRKRAGDQLRVFNGRDGEWLAEIALMTKREAVLDIKSRLREQIQVPDIHLLFAPVKKERSHFIVEKATELGASQIQPVITARTVTKLRMNKLSAYVQGAAEQTERLDLPQICAPIKLGALLADWDETRTLIFADEAGDAEPAAAALAKIKAPAAILIGPEGGFTSDERTLLRARPYCIPISLGPRILRADTAATATLALWQAVNGDW